MLNLIHFQEKIVHFSLKNEALRSESVQTPIISKPIKIGLKVLQLGHDLSIYNSLKKTLKVF